MSHAADRVEALRRHSRSAKEIGDVDAARILAGYAETIEKDPTAVSRIQRMLSDRCKVFLGPAAETTIARIWKTALADMVTPPAAPKPPPSPKAKASKATPPAAKPPQLADVSALSLAPAPPPAAVIVVTKCRDCPAPARIVKGVTKSRCEACAEKVRAYAKKYHAERPRRLRPADVTAIVEAAVQAAVAPLREEIAALKEQIRLSRQARRRLDGVRGKYRLLRGIVNGHDEQIQALLARTAPKTKATTHADTTVPLHERLRQQALPDGRTWLDVVEHFAKQHDVTVSAILSMSRMHPIPAARFAIWRWLYLESGAHCSLPFIASVWGVDHTSVLYGVQRVEGRSKGLRARAIPAIPAPPKSGPRVSVETGQASTGSDRDDFSCGST